MKLERNPFGITSDGKAVDSITMENGNGIRCTFITYGASLTSFRMPDRSGHIDELTLGFDNLASYEGNHPYYGATVGRFANRIAKGSFSIDGIDYKVDINEPPNHLHGGKEGFSRKIWEMFPIRREKEAGATFTLTSEDGDAGFPGTVDVSLTVLLTEGNELIFSYTAVSDKPTPINLTNHSYWNLAGSCSRPIYDHILTLHSDAFLEPDEELIPTGRKINVANTPFDFRSPKAIGRDIEAAGGYDHCFILSHEHALSIPAAEVKDEKSGRSMTVLTINPGVQFYTGNMLSGQLTRDGIAAPHSAFCLETQEFPDAMNHDNFPMAILRPGERYERKTMYLFSVE
ncbi:aldose epimerase family protein [Sediminispirochaeta bajacaliforniensis]|uniref:aldose epimerase family protein n=1 Tax=Sediminispirochaeta bajacaliforniensis TaxID=148 RepID=UPI00037F7877|nr:aldose epimerase family protein [Sediminispirochaeta bajacaliforniensis]